MTATLSPHLAVEQTDGISIVRFLDREIWEVFGEGGNVRALAAALRELVENGRDTWLLLDLSEVEFLCSAMLGVLLRLKRQVEEVHGKLVLCGLTSPRVREVFRISGLERHFEIVEAAWVALARAG